MRSGNPAFLRGASWKPEFLSLPVNDGGWTTHSNKLRGHEQEAAHSGRSLCGAVIGSGGTRAAPRALSSRGTANLAAPPKVAMEPPWFGGRHHYGKLLLGGGVGRRIQAWPGTRAPRMRGERIYQQARVSMGPVGEYVQDAWASIRRDVCRIRRDARHTLTPIGSGVQSGGLLTEG